jgi:hypothetical protein
VPVPQRLVRTPRASRRVAASPKKLSTYIHFSFQPPLDYDSHYDQKSLKVEWIDERVERGADTTKKTLKNQDSDKVTLFSASLDTLSEGL